MKGCGRTVAGLPCCTIILGDCNDYLWQFAPGDVDLVVTDPPYGMNYLSGTRNEAHHRIHGDDAYPVETVNNIIQIPRLGSYFWCRWDNLWEHGALPKPKSVITWYKHGFSMGDLEHEHGRGTELALFYPGPDHKFKKRPGDVLEAKRTGNQIHPTQKPYELIKQMLEWYDFETVLDPFSGSGSTARAARELGKHFLGFEIDEGYHHDGCENAMGHAKEVDVTNVAGGLFGR